MQNALASVAAPGRFLQSATVLCFLHDPSALQEAHDQQDEGDDQQHVKQGAEVKGKVTERPEDDQDDDDEPQHGYLSISPARLFSAA